MIYSQPGGAERWLLKNRLRTVLTALFGLAGFLSAQPPTIDPAKLDTGARIYATTCVTCHGPDGDATGGVNLRTGQFKRASTDLDLMSAILHGVPGTAMPANALPNADLLALVAYLRSMKDYGVRKVALGDAERGRSVFEGKGACLNCHRVANKGSYRGPDLTETGAAHSAAYFEDTLTNPEATAQPGNRTIRATLKNGDVVTGRRLNEDTWSVQIMSSEEKLVSLWKPDLRDYTILKTPMPSYREKLTPGERADLIAYLVSIHTRKAGATK